MRTRSASKCNLKVVLYRLWDRDSKLEAIFLKVINSIYNNVNNETKNNTGIFKTEINNTAKIEIKEEIKTEVKDEPATEISSFKRSTKNHHKIQKISTIKSEPLATMETRSQRAKSKNSNTSSHKSKKLHICRFCGKPCSSPSELVIHVRTHTGERPFECKICFKSFASNSELRKHLRNPIHPSSTSKICGYCGKRCSCPSELLIHIRIHTGEKPFRCLDCCKAFKSNSELRSHLRASIHIDKNRKNASGVATMEN